MGKGCVLLIIYAIEVNGGVRLTVRLCPRLDLYEGSRDHELRLQCWRLRRSHAARLDRLQVM